MYMFTVFPWVTNLSCFKQRPSNFTLVLLLLPINLNAGARQLSDVVGSLTISSGNPLDFHDEIWLVSPIFSKYLYIDWNTKWFWVPSTSKWLLSQK